MPYSASMPLVPTHARELVLKIVFYGPGLSGKTRSLQHMYEATPPAGRGKLLRLVASVDRPISFDYLPLRGAPVQTRDVRLQLFTVPGSFYYNAARKLVLTGIDGLIFVADSHRRRADANVESLQSLNENLRDQERTLRDIPHVFQYNKRDLTSVTPTEQLNEMLNVWNAPTISTVASAGVGIQETIDKLTEEIGKVIEDTIPALSIDTARQSVRPTNGATPASSVLVSDKDVRTSRAFSFADLWSGEEQVVVREAEAAIASGELSHVATALAQLGTWAALSPAHPDQRASAFFNELRALREGTVPEKSRLLALYAFLIEHRLGKENRELFLPMMRVPLTRLLLVDDEPSVRQMLQILFQREGYDVVSVSGYRSGVDALTSSPQPFPLVVTDLLMPDGSGLDIVQVAKRRDPATEVIVMTAHTTIDTAVDAMRRGAYDFIGKPFVASELSALVGKAFEKFSLATENRRLRAQVQGDHGLLGRSAAMRRVSELIDRVAMSRTTVLITGESGTGKERVARALHERSDRASKPLLVVNCGALPEALMESELFGHEKGSFTGANARHAGIFRDAQGGTVFLDEVGELPLPLQVKLLRVLQERKVRPVGTSHEEAVDVRVLAATNREIEEEVKAGRFRQDLYYRLNVIRITLPPLRERVEELSDLTQHFLERFANEMGKDVRGLTADALRALDRYSFPGNVRELENILERAVALAVAPTIGLGELPSEVSGHASSSAAQLMELPAEGCDLDEILGEVERRYLLQALEKGGGVRKRAAKLLNVTFRSLRYRLAKYGLDVEDDMMFPEDETSSDVGEKR